MILFHTCVLTAGVISRAPDRVLLKLKAGVPENEAKGIILSRGAVQMNVIPHIGVRVLKVAPSALSTDLDAFSHNPKVEFAEPDAVFEPALVPDDPYFSSQWHLVTIAAPTAWDTTTGSSNVVIAILDTGVDGTHPDLASNLVPGWNTYDNNSDTADIDGHGTEVAGAAAAASNNGIGVASVAFKCSIMPIRVSGTDGWAYASQIGMGLVWAADHGARVANISYEMTVVAAVSSAAQYFDSKGGVVTVSAGNYSTVLTNAHDPNLLTVSATDRNDALASWSNSGTPIDLAAPGVDIFTTTRGGGYASVSGTSLSAPLVAGVAALVISVDPSLSSAQVQQVLESSADDLGAPGWDPDYGWGRVNAQKAVSMAATLATLQILSVAPSSEFSSSGTVGGPFTPASQDYVLTNAGGSPLNWQAGTTNDWLTLSQTNGVLSAGQATNVTVSLNGQANLLSTGSYFGSVSFTNLDATNAGTIRAVTLTVWPPPGVLSVAPSSEFSSSGTVGGPFTPASQDYVLTNAGGSPLNWQAGTTNDWLTLSQTNGVLSAGQATNVTVSLNGQANLLSAGTYSGGVSISDVSNGNGNATRNVTLSVLPAPGRLAAFPLGALIALGHQKGPFVPPAYTFMLTNSGGSGLNWTASVGGNWISLSATNGSLGAHVGETLSATIDEAATELPVGTNMAEVSFKSSTGQTNDQTVTLEKYPLHFSTPMLGSTGGVFTCTLSGVPGWTYVIESSASLSNWGAAFTNVTAGSNGEVLFKDEAPASSTNRFYRARWMPN